MTNPKLITTAFAENGTANDIPNTNSDTQNPQLATMDLGFPDITQKPIAEGGIPPERADFNGILKLYGQHIVHLNKGLGYEFDADFATAIGGYPLHARIVLTNGNEVKNTIPANTTNPNTDMTGWELTGGARTDAQLITWSGRTQEEVNKRVVYAEDVGLLGDGSDETEKLKSLFKYSNIVFSKDKTYKFTEQLTLQFINIQMNGSQLLFDGSSVGYALTVGDYVSCSDQFRLIRNSNGHGILVNGDNPTFDTLEVKATSPIQRFGVRFEKTVGAVDNITIRKIKTSNFSSHVQFFNISNSIIDRVVMDTYTTGLYIKDMYKVNIGSVSASTMFPNITGTSGSNGILIEATKHHGVRHCSIGKCTISNSGEHAIRFGGSWAIDDVDIGPIYAYKAGSGSSPVGGSCLKILGGNTTVPAEYHTNIRVHGLYCEDASLTNANNFSSLMILFAKHVTVYDHKVVKKDNPRACGKVMLLASVSDVSIYGSYCDSFGVNGIQFSTNELTTRELDIIEDVKIYNLDYTVMDGAKVGYPLWFNNPAGIIQRNYIQGKISCNVIARQEPTTTGSIGGVVLDIIGSPAYSDTSGLPPPLQVSTGVGEFIIKYTGKWYGSYSNGGSDGSTFTDPYAAPVFRVKSGGTWKTLA